jgi:hypothetical protein
LTRERLILSKSDKKNARKFLKELKERFFCCMFQLAHSDIVSQSSTSLPELQRSCKLIRNLPILDGRLFRMAKPLHKALSSV